MVFVNEKKFACQTCIKGHRSSSCYHTDRPLFEIKKKGRPITQCEHCRELRKTKQLHIKCHCDGRDDGSGGVKKGQKGPFLPAFPLGLGSDVEATLSPSSLTSKDKVDDAHFGIRRSDAGDVSRPPYNKSSAPPSYSGHMPMESPSQEYLPTYHSNMSSNNDFTTAFGMPPQQISPAESTASFDSQLHTPPNPSQFLGRNNSGYPFSGQVTSTPVFAGWPAQPAPQYMSLQMYNTCACGAMCSPGYNICVTCMTASTSLPPNLRSMNDIMDAFSPFSPSQRNDTDYGWAQSMGSNGRIDEYINDQIPRGFAVSGEREKSRDIPSGFGEVRQSSTTREPSIHFSSNGNTNVPYPPLSQHSTSNSVPQPSQQSHHSIQASSNINTASAPAPASDTHHRIGFRSSLKRRLLPKPSSASVDSTLLQSQPLKVTPSHDAPRSDRRDIYSLPIGMPLNHRI